MLTEYSKPPIDDPKPVKKPVKKSKNKNVNPSNIEDQLYDPYPALYENNPKEYSPNTKNNTFTNDDYMDDNMTEEQAEMFFATFVNEDHKCQLELEEDVDELFNEKMLNSETDGDLENMRKICRDSAESFLPYQAYYDEEIVDEYLRNDEDFITAVQIKIIEIIKQNQKSEKNETEYLNKFPSLGEANEVDPLDFLKPTNNYKIEEPNNYFSYFQLNDPKNYWNSNDDVYELSLVFPFIGINYINYAYISFGNKFEITKSFLNEYFKISHKPIPIRKNVKPIQKKKRFATQNIKKQYDDSYDFNPIIEEIDPELRNETFASLRDKLSKHLRLKMILKHSEATCSRLKNYGEGNKFKNLANEQDGILNKYIKASKVMFLEDLRKRKNYRVIDLHGLFLEEAIEILVDQIHFLRSKMTQGLLFDCVTKEIQKNTYLKYDIITGKGNNSKNKTPVLLPSLKKFLEKKNYSFKAIDHEGKIELFLPF